MLVNLKRNCDLVPALGSAREPICVRRYVARDVHLVLSQVKYFKNALADHTTW